MDFTEVSSIEQLKIFNELWVEVWQEKGYELEFTEEECDRFILFEDELAIGTIELKKHNGVSKINETFPFNLTTFDYCKVVEVDKIALIKKHRTIKNFGKLLILLSNYTYAYRVDCFIGLVEPMLYRLLHMKFGNIIEKIGEKFYYKGDFVIPITIETRKLLYDNSDIILNVLSQYGATFK